MAQEASTSADEDVSFYDTRGRGFQSGDETDPVRILGAESARSLCSGGVCVTDGAGNYGNYDYYFYDPYMYEFLEPLHCTDSD